MKKTIRIEGMTCSHCVMRVKKALEGVAGVQSAEILLADKKAVVDVADGVADAILRDAVTGAGYDVTGIA
jgi:copper chaperone CopZ